MKRLEILSYPINNNVPSYRGLYRAGLTEKYTKLNEDDIKKYYLLPGKEFIDCTAENIKKLLILSKKLCPIGSKNEIIIAFDKKKLDKKEIDDIPINLFFIGYDICSEHGYYSPLGDGFLSSDYDNSKDFMSELTESQFENFRDNLNEFLLFSSYEIAQSFSEYCNYINNVIPGVIEFEEKWRPYAIYVANNLDLK